MRERAGRADVISFYTHGRHASDAGPSIDLADGALGVGQVADEWAGAERVELWACQSGVSLPLDWLTPVGVDEPFGLDFQLLRLGARSAIGTLWDVPEVVTAAIVRDYRRRLGESIAAPAALAAAQRWWLNEGSPALVALLAERPLDCRLSRPFTPSFSRAFTPLARVTVWADRRWASFLSA